MNYILSLILSVVVSMYAFPSLVSASPLTTEITGINPTGIDYTNSVGGLYVGIDYTTSLENIDWVLAESTGFVQYSPTTSGSITLPTTNIFELFPMMFFRTRVSELPFHDFVNYETPIPKFVSNNYIDLSKIGQISRFRSGMGHDYPDDFESCRSMKHYFDPNVEDYSTIEIFSPVDGVITSMVESNGIRINIKSSAYPAYQFIIFHVEALEGLEVGDSVTAGEKIGNHIYNLADTTISDIAVQRFVLHESSYKTQLISYFDVMTDDHFSANYVGTEIENRSDLIISKEQRDASPLECEGEEFVGDEYGDGGYGLLQNWVSLD